MTEIKRITLYKIKPGNDFEVFLRGDLAGYDHIIDEANGFEAYVKYENAGGSEKTDEQVPWLRFLNSGFENKKYHFQARNRFPRALMALKVAVENEDPVYYAAAFGQHGDSYLNKAYIAYDFGIKVGMNICNLDAGLKRVQTAAHEAITKQTERQASTGTNLGVFGINMESEFLRAISGHVAEDYRADVDSFKGRDSISIKLPKDRDISWADLAVLCSRLEERYNSKDYADTDFRVYDILRHEGDPLVIEQLDALLVEQIAARNFEKIHLAPPEFVDTDDIAYAYKGMTDEGDPPPLFDDLRIADLVAVPKRRLKNLTADTIKRWKIFTYDYEQGRVFPAWNAYQCLVAEIDLGNRTFVVANGQWREVSQELKQKVERYFNDHDLSVDAPYLPEGVDIFDGDRQQNREEIFNRRVATDHAEIYLFDKAKLPIAGVSKYEVCDLFHLDKKMVHVKKYSSGAASISHLFIQGKFYSHAFSTDEACRAGMCAWVDDNEDAANQPKDGDAFKAIIPVKNTDVAEPEYTIIFCVLHGRPQFGIDNLPFMSRYELMLSHRFLTEDRRFKVGIAFRGVRLGGAEARAA